MRCLGRSGLDFPLKKAFRESELTGWQFWQSMITVLDSEKSLKQPQPSQRLVH
jgi:hypothetical protein